MVKKTGPSRKAAPSKQSNKKSAAPAQNQEASSPPPLQSQAEQQRLLDVFSNAFKSTLTSDDFAGLLQEVKQALFNRDFATAFGREDYLEAYAARWSPTRTLCYNTVFLGINEHLDGILASEEGSSGGKNLESSTQAGLAKDSGALEQDTKPGEASAETGPDAPKPERSQPRSTLRMLSIGGCAAEHLAFASYLQSTSSNGHLTLLDSAPWASVISSLESSTNSPPPISKYASATARAANRALLEPGQLSVEVVQQDVLALDVDSLTARCAGGKVPIVVTLLFTLNELYTSGGIGKTTKFLKNLGQALAPGSLVLVVDSPGSYSEAALGKEKKRYPMQWLLDHTLLETETPGYSWEKLQSDDSIWFRLPEGLSYPIPLENMRYQIHLYRLEKSS
jgi:25S rRNA (uracil2843-N3)-methyltransferase